MAEFHFIRQGWLLLFIPFLVIFSLLLQRRLNRGNWESVCDADLLPYVLLDKPSAQKRWPLLWFAVAGILAILALAGPTWQRLPAPVFRNEAAVVIILDLSVSMDAPDIKPSRLERARFKIKDLLNRRKDGQTALVVYTGDVFTVTPLTSDTDTISNHLSELKPSLMPVGGSDTERALKHAKLLLKQGGLTRGHLVLVTDGVDAVAANNVARRLKSEGFLLSVLGVGTESGAPIPQGQGGFLKDSTGNIVVPKLRSAELRELARNGGGVFHLLTADNRDINAIDSMIGRQRTASHEEDSGITIDQWEEIGPWLLLPLLLISAFAFRKGLIASVVFAVIFPFQDAWALSWDDLWATRDQQANRAYHRGESTQAAALFENRRWKGAAEYSSGEYAKTVESLAGMEDADSLYNSGNALARLGRYQQAVEAYKQALEIDPMHRDAIYNKKVIEEQLKQQQQQQQQTPQDSSNTESKDGEQQNPKTEQATNADEKPANSQQNATSQDSNQSSPMNEGEEKDDGAVSEMNSQESPERQSESQSKNGEESEMESEQMASSSMPVESDKPDESEQANEQWLRRIPDDPGRLLREKFRYEYRRRQQESSGEIQ